MKLDTRNRDIIIIGYYGQGNFGDDLLALYIIRLLKKAVSENRIMVTAPEGNYLEKWFPEIMSVSLPYALHHLTDSPKSVVFGGGGLFFQFEKPSLMNLFGARGNLMWHCLRHARIELKNNLRLYAFCIGIGPLNGYGAKFITRKLCSITDHVSVRDESSAKFINAVNCEIVTDPVLGLSDLIVCDNFSHGKAVGFIIRCWYSSDKLIVKLKQVAEKLRQEGFKVSFISFERQADSQAIAFLKELGETNVSCWDPTLQNVEDFCTVLSPVAS